MGEVVVDDFCISGLKFEETNFGDSMFVDADEEFSVGGGG